MYDVRPNLIIGFHGCDDDISNSLLNSPNNIKVSKEPHDWLGHGMYFWENNYDRALEWAKDKKRRGAIKTPSVIGAIIQLGYCCDFLDTRYIKMLKSYHKLMVESYKVLGEDLPANKDIQQDKHKDKILRELDCTTIEFMHSKILSQYEEDMHTKKFSDLKIFESTRGMFTEGGPAFPGAGIFEKSHSNLYKKSKLY